MDVSLFSPSEVYAPAKVTRDVSPERVKVSWWPAVVVGLLHFVWLAVFFAPAYFSPDANGYHAQARMIATNGSTARTVESPVQFVGMHWLEMPDGSLRSRYPAGMPVLVAALYALGGAQLALWLNPMLAAATTGLVFLLGRRVAGAWAGLLAAAIFAVNATVNRHALSADAHSAATFFLVAGVLTLLRFADRSRVVWGLLAGLLLGAIPTIRYPEAVCALGLGGWLLWRVRPVWRIWPAMLGAGVPVGALLAHNHFAYGAFWKTGYAYTNEQTGFSLGNLADHAGAYLRSIPGDGLLFVGAFAVAGLGAMIADRRRRSEGMLFAGLVVPLVLVYMAYYWGASGPGGATTMGLRFLIPTFPFFAVAAAWLLVELSRSNVPGVRVAITVVLVLHFALAGSAAWAEVARMGRSTHAVAEIEAVLRQHVPEEAVLIVNDRQLAESLDYSGRWKLADGTLLDAARGSVLRRGRPEFGPMDERVPGRRGVMPGAGGVVRDPDAPSPMQADKLQARRERYGNLSAAERTVKVWSDITAWTASSVASEANVVVYWLAPAGGSLDLALPEGATSSVIARVAAPANRFGGRGAVAPLGPPGNLPVQAADPVMELVRVALPVQRIAGPS